MPSSNEAMLDGVSSLSLTFIFGSIWKKKYQLKVVFHSKPSKCKYQVRFNQIPIGQEVNYSGWLVGNNVKIMLAQLKLSMAMLY